MFDRVLSVIAPHPCYGCRVSGALLCDNCKYNIAYDAIPRCVVCEAPLSARDSCKRCKLPYDKQWYVGDRDGVLRALIDGVKFERQYAGIDILVALLDARLPQLPPNTILVSIPTIRSHVRQRGYDAVQEIAKRLAARRTISWRPCLQRATNTRQRGASKRERQVQASEAFTALPASPKPIYLIIDDVVTTGATVSAAAQVMRAAGAQTVWVAALARQPLD